MANETFSTHRTVAVAGVHRFKVAGHSLTRGKDACVTSKPFHVGGHDWAVRYYVPNGLNDSHPYAEVYLVLLNAGERDVTASCSFCLQADPAAPAPAPGTTMEEKHRLEFVATFSSTKSALGSSQFFSQADLAASGCLKDDCLVIKCTVQVITSKLIDGHEDDDEAENGGNGVVVPPSDMSQNFGHLLESGVATDITVSVRTGWFRRFKAHRCVLAARSPVFRALLCGSMKESKESSIPVDDMNASVFELLLHYMYNDSLPASMEEEETTTTTNMAQHLLVAADRYGMERLKAICERKLSKALDVDTAATTLEFAERHHCRQLKDCCLRFMARDRERLRAIMKTKGFSELNRNCPLIARHILEFLIVKPKLPADDASYS